VLDKILDPPKELTDRIPEIVPMIGLDQNHPNHQYDAWEHMAYTVDEAIKDEIVRVAAFFHDVGKGEILLSGGGGYYFKGHMEIIADVARRVLKEMGAPEDTIERVAKLIEIHDVDVPHEEVSEWIEEFGKEDFIRLIELQKADALAHCEPYRTETVNKAEALRQFV
jgi:tRNA nucleotidyltransferase (CCA-adding enzyme)